MREEDFIARLEGQRRRRALVMLGVMLVAIALVVVGLDVFIEETMTPDRPLARWALTRSPATYEAEVPDAGSVALWIEVVQRSERRSTGNPFTGAQVVVQHGDRRMVCATTAVDAYATRTRSGSRVSWTGRLSDCGLGSVKAGPLEVHAHWTPPDDPPAGVTVERVTLIPSRDD